MIVSVMIVDEELDLNRCRTTANDKHLKQRHGSGNRDAPAAVFLDAFNSVGCLFMSTIIIDTQDLEFIICKANGQRQKQLESQMCRYCVDGRSMVDGGAWRWGRKKSPPTQLALQ